MPLRGDGSLDQRRVYKPSGSGIDGGYRVGHADATGEVARSLSDIARLPTHRARRTTRGGRRRARNGRQGNGALLNHALPTFDPILGPRSQERSRIGANGIVVLRLRVPCLLDAGSCSLALMWREWTTGSVFGRVPRYKADSGGPGEPSGATRDPRGRPGRPPDCPDGRRTAPTHVPGRVRG